MCYGIDSIKIKSGSNIVTLYEGQETLSPGRGGRTPEEAEELMRGSTTTIRCEENEHTYIYDLDTQAGNNTGNVIIDYYKLSD